jgi:hypothetical protein
VSEWRFGFWCTIVLWVDLILNHFIDFRLGFFLSFFLLLSVDNGGLKDWLLWLGFDGCTGGPFLVSCIVSGYVFGSFLLIVGIFLLSGFSFFCGFIFSMLLCNFIILFFNLVNSIIIIGNSFLSSRSDSYY